MSGTPNGIIDVFQTGVLDEVAVLVLYADLIDALDAAVNVTQIARQDDVAEPDNRWVVYRFDATAERPWDWYLYLGLSDGDGTGTHDGPVPGSTGTSQAYIVAQCARGIGGDENPWLGTTNADGSDTKPTPWWGVPSGGTNVQVLPASNGEGGANEANLDGGINVAYYSTGGNIDSRHSVVVDDDNIAVVVSTARHNNDSYTCFAATWVHPNDEEDTDGGTLFTFYMVNTVNESATFGRDNSGIFDPRTDPALGCGSLTGTGTIPSSMTNGQAADHPNAIAGDVYEEFTFGVWAEDGAFAKGFMGIMDPFIGGIFQVDPEDSNAALTRAYFGNSSLTQMQIAIHWDGVTTPGTHGTNAGVTF